MKGKILNHIKKVIVVSAIIILCSTNASYALTIGGKTERIGTLRDFFGRFYEEEKEEYSLMNLQADLRKMENSGSADITQITNLIEKLPEGSDKDILSGITDMFDNLSINLEGIELKALVEKLLTTLLDAIGSLLGGIGDIGDIGNIIGGIGSIIGGSTSSLPVEAKSIYIDAKTAVEFAGTDAVAKLHANVYMHVDENGNEDSNKWAFLIHPFMLDGTSIAGSVGTFYYEKGFNIIAPDLRGFGDSEGSVALGCLESMDMYDWLVKLNDEFTVSQVIVHGVSLGAATTNYLSGIDGFINNGPTKITTKIKPIKELNVIGLVEDCGYVDMEEFGNQAKSYSGIKEHYDYYSKATESLVYCEIPMMIIHGDGDTTVNPENAETIRDILAKNKVPVKVHKVEDGAHAYIIIGGTEEQKEEYRVFVHDFIENCQKIETNKVEQSESVNGEETTTVKVYVNNDKSFAETVKRLLRLGR